MNKFLFGLFAGVCLPLLAGYLFVTRGGMPVATKSPPLPFERLIAKTALRAARRGQSSRPSPIPADESNILAGAKVYAAQCAVCHGTWDGHESDIALGMFPQPPQLLPPKKGVTDDPVGKTYWTVSNGIRLTGMPGFGDTLSETELWQVTLLLRHADHLPVSAQQALK